MASQQQAPGALGTTPKGGVYPKNFVRSQEHLLQRSDYNPEPTTMPPPTAGLAGAIGERHVICFVGLPARGKQFMAERLCRYLKFFHGAQCEIFDLANERYGTDESVGDAITGYLEEEDETATTQLLRSLEGIDDDSLDRLKKNVDSGKIAIIDTSDAFKTQRRAWSGTSKETRWAMQKHLAALRVRVKLLFIEVIVTDARLVRRFLRQRLAPSESSVAQQKRTTTQKKNNESASKHQRKSKGDAPAAAAAVATTTAADGDVCASSSSSSSSGNGGGGSTQTQQTDAALEAKVNAALSKINDFGRAYVTIQDDGSEDDLAYVKLINYGDKVVTNKIRGFLLMQIVKYLSHVHPNPRTVYLSRHGQSQYNLVEKIGGNPSLTDSGERYARWLGAWVPANVWPAKEATLGSSTDFVVRDHRSSEVDVRPRRSTVDHAEAEAALVSQAGKEPSPTPTEGGPPNNHPSGSGPDDDGDDDDEAVDPSTGRKLFGRVYNVYDPKEETSRPTIIRPARLWTSTLKRTIDTARHVPHPVLELRGGGVWHQMLPRVYRNLDEIFAGDYEGMTYDDIEANFGGESILRKKDKLGYRYPRGESYLDLIARLDPLMHELESYVEPLLIVSHQATLRIVYSYLVGLPRAEAPKIEIPLHTVIKLCWDGWQSFSEVRFRFHDDESRGSDILVSQSDGQQFL